MEKTGDFENPLHEVETQDPPPLEELGNVVADVNRKVLQFVKERPGTCLIGAVAVGFLIGRLFRARG
jgi:hypothetical protein